MMTQEIALKDVKWTQINIYELWEMVGVNLYESVSFFINLIQEAFTHIF